MESFFQYVLHFVQTHAQISYIILFFWSVFDTLVPVCFFIYGEVFFLVGAVLSWLWMLDIFTTCTVLFLWGLIGDNLSYYLWKHYWIKVIDGLRGGKIIWKMFSMKRQEKFQKLFARSWGPFIFVARIWWPLAKITPFLAGAFKYPYERFVLFNTPAVFFWIGIFIVIWYFLWANFEVIRKIFWVYFPFFTLAFILLLVCIYFYKKYFWKPITDE